MYFNSHRLDQDRAVLISILFQAFCLTLVVTGFWAFSQFSQLSVQASTQAISLAADWSHSLPAIPAWCSTLPLLLYAGYRGVQWGMQRLWERVEPRRAVIVGANTLGQRLSQQLQLNRSLNLKVCGFFDWQHPSESQIVSQQYLGQPYLGQPYLGTPEQLPDYIARQQIDVVYIAIPSEDAAQLAALLQKLQNTTACVYLIPNIAGVDLSRSRVYNLNGLPVLALWEIPFSGLQSLLKRGLDLLVSGMALLLLSPLLAVIALGVKLSSPGPILFKQRRHGMNGQEILVYKFRSMKVMEDGQQVRQAQRHDNRVTKFGAFLRKTSLDELPQLMNVLQGQMSLVGPRPHAVAHNEQYRQLLDGYMRRHKVKPGMTGWAQVNGCRGETDTLDKMQRRLEYDLSYIQNWSLPLDFQILLRTTLVFFQTENVY